MKNSLIESVIYLIVSLLLATLTNWMWPESGISQYFSIGGGAVAGYIFAKGIFGI